MGNHGTGGYNSSSTLYNTVDGGRVTVPAKIWKVIIVIPKGNSDLSRIDTSATIVVVNMPNDNRLFSIGGAGNTAWRNYSTSINNLELEANGNGVQLNLLQSVPSNIRTYLKAKVF
jgi:endonuclease G